MFQKLVSRNEDLSRLVEKGYAVAFAGNCLVVRDIPYLDQYGALQMGAIVTKLEFIDGERVKQEDHQVMFAGGVPHGLDGKPIPNLGDRGARYELCGDCAEIVVERQFSNKPIGGNGYSDFHEKIEAYVAIIAGPAVERHHVSPLTFRIQSRTSDESVFELPDSNSSRAGTGGIGKQLAGDIVALIGLGGTGAYVLDLLVKSPVREIRAFDNDTFCVHNAFRSPGRLCLDELGCQKAAVYQDRYANFRKGLTAKSQFIDASSASDLEGVTFAFICVDKGSSRAEIAKLLSELGIPFVDVGMGVTRQSSSLNGQLRTTHLSPENASQVLAAGHVPMTDPSEGIYREDVQIAELNALNACLAVIRYKQVRGFYSGDDVPFHSVFSVSAMKLMDLEGPDEVQA